MSTQPGQTEPDVYLLTHTFRGGESVNTFHYYPTPSAPYPDIRKVANELLAEVYSEDTDSIQLLPVDHEPDMTFVPDDKVGCRIFEEFHEGPLVVVPTGKQR